MFSMKTNYTDLNIIKIMSILDEKLVNSTNENRKKAILVAGQSNTSWATQFGVSPVNTGGLDLKITQLARHNQNDLIPTISGLTNIHFQTADGARTSYAYSLAKDIRNDIGCEELLIIPCAIGGTGWSGGQWSASGSLYQDMIARVEYTVKILKYDIVGIFWSQGESDTNSSISSVYKYLLYSLVSTLRTVIYNSGQGNAHNIPFVTFDMVTNWVGSDVDRLNVQNALETIGNNINFTANADTTNLPSDLENDIIHYDTRQIIELGHRLFDAWKIALNNDLQNIYQNTPGETILYNRDYGQYYSNIWEALYFGNSETDNKFSRLSDIWKYENNGKFKFKLEWTISSQLYYIIWEQNYIPYFCVPLMCAASLMEHSNGAVFGRDDGMGFVGLVFDGVDTFIKLNSSGEWWTPLGQKAYYGGGIPISNINGDKLASNIKLKAIKT